MKIILASALRITDICGVTTHIKTLGKGFQQLGHEVDYATLSSIPRIIVKLVISLPFFMLKKLHSSFQFVFYFIAIKYLLMGVLLIKHIKCPYDIINTQDPYAQNSTFLVRKLFNIPTILRMNSYLSDLTDTVGIKKGSLAERSLVHEFKKSFKSSDQIISADSRIKNYLISQYNVPPKKIITAINFVDIDEFKPRDTKSQFRKIFGIPNKQIVVLCPRRLVPKNGVVYAAKSIKYLKAKMKEDFVMVFTGNIGHEAETIKEIVKKDKTQENLLFVPHILHDHMKYLYNASNIVIIPSINYKGLEEATSFSAIEAMASGVPVIASNIGGLKEIIEDNVTGYLVEEKNPEKLAEKIYEVFIKEQSEIIDNARAYVVDNCSHIKRAKEFVKLYNEFTKETGG